MNYFDIAGYVIEKALSAGASYAEAILIDSSDVQAETRLGNLVNIQRSQDCSISIRVIINQQQAIIALSQLTKNALDSSIIRAIDMAKVTPTNPFLCVATAEQMVKSYPDLNLFDSQEPSTNQLIAWAQEAEQTALQQKGISNSEGASSSYSSSRFYFANSSGFSGQYNSSIFCNSISILSGEKENMQTGDDFTISRFASSLKPAKEIGLLASQRAISKLNPRKLVSAEMPVIFDKRVAKSLLSNFASAINGAAISRGTSFLTNSLNQELFSPSINIIDDPFIEKALGSRPFDAETISGKKLNIVENGVLKHYLLDLQTAKKLNMETTGHASRGLTSAPNPSPSNFYMLNGDKSLPTILKEIKTGLLVTEKFGYGANIINGDYSQGIVGFFVENGEISYPVSKITIASNLKYMLKNMTAANDLTLDYAINSPSIMIDRMTVAGM
jgi:PmbA protein